MDESLKWKIISEGEKTIIEDEPVLGGLTRPILVEYRSSDGVVEERWDYVRDSAYTPWWGAINSVSTSIKEIFTSSLDL